MPRIQLLADTEYFSAFSTYLETIDGIELVGQSPDILLDAMFLDPKLKLQALSKLDSSHSLVLSNTLTVSATTAQRAVGSYYRVIGLPIFPYYFDRQKTIEYSLPYGASEGDGELQELFATLGKTGELIADGVAGVFPRTLAMIINEAAFAVQEGVASAEDIDVAMRLGTNYPTGPLTWCDEIGARSVVAVLDALSREYGSERYRVASLLRRYAEANIRFTPKAEAVTA